MSGDDQVGMNDRFRRIAWRVWWVFLIAYLGLNAAFLFRLTEPDIKIALGWGIIMPILTNLVWWVISFRLRNRVELWWAFGITTAFAVGIAGFLTLLWVSKLSPLA